MRNYGRRAALALLLLVLWVVPLAAQDETTEATPEAPAGLTVVGSSAAGNIFRQAVEAGGAEVELTYDLSGTQGGAEAFCQAQADLLVASRALTAVEVSNCTTAEVNFTELVVAIDGYALIASPDVDFVECVSSADLNTLVSPSAAANLTNWNQLDPVYPDLAFGFASAQAGTRAYDLLDGVVNGEGFRGDTVFGSDAEVVAAVAGGSGQLGLVSMGAALSAEGVTVLELNNPTLGICAAPGAAATLNRSYSGGERVFVYVNGNALEALTPALTAVLGAEGQAAVAAAGAVALDETTLALAQETLNGAVTGRVFSRELDTFQPAFGVSGELRLGGSATITPLLQGTLALFTQSNPGATLTENYLGAVAGARELCNGNLDVAVSVAPLTEEQLAACEALEITVVSYDLGAQAAVLIANAGNAEAACLSVEQVARLWTASADAPALWSDLGEGFAANESEIILFGASKSDPSLNLLLTTANGSPLPVRDGLNENADVQYLGAAVANVPGGLAVMSYAQAQEVIESGAGVQVVSVSGADGTCVAPSVESVSDGSYPFAQSVTLLINQTSLETDLVQAALWNLLADGSYIQLEQAGLVGLNLDTLTDRRAALQVLFAEADAIEAERFAAETSAIATQTAEAATPVAGEPTAEATPEAPVDEPTIEATPEAPVEEPTVEATGDGEEAEATTAP